MYSVTTIAVDHLKHSMEPSRLARKSKACDTPLSFTYTPSLSPYVILYIDNTLFFAVCKRIIGDFMGIIGRVFQNIRIE